MNQCVNIWRTRYIWGSIPAVQTFHSIKFCTLYIFISATILWHLQRSRKSRKSRNQNNNKRADLGGLGSFQTLIISNIIQKDGKPPSITKYQQNSSRIRHKYRPQTAYEAVGRLEQLRNFFSVIYRIPKQFVANHENKNWAHLKTQLAKPLVLNYIRTVWMTIT